MNGYGGQSTVNEAQVDFVTLKPRWSVSDLFGKRNGKASRARILAQLNEDYLSKGWELADEIHWGKDYGFAVMKLGRVA